MENEDVKKKDAGLGCPDPDLVLQNTPENSKDIPQKLRGFEARGRKRRDDPNPEWKGVKTIITSVIFDEKQYDEVSRISYEERIPKKTALKRLIQIGIRIYSANGSFPSNTD